MCPAVDHLVMHQAPVEIREHRLRLRRHGCSHVVLAYMSSALGRRGCQTT